MRKPKNTNEILQSLMEKKGYRNVDIASITGMSNVTITHLVSGRTKITAFTAVRLENIPNGYTAEEWMTMQAAYDLYNARKEYKSWKPTKSLKPSLYGITYPYKKVHSFRNIIEYATDAPVILEGYDTITYLEDTLEASISVYAEGGEKLSNNHLRNIKNVSADQVISTLESSIKKRIVLVVKVKDMCYYFGRLYTRNRSKKT